MNRVIALILVLAVLGPVIAAPLHSMAYVDTSIRVSLVDWLESYRESDIYRLNIEYRGSGIVFNVTYANTIKTYTFMDVLGVNYQRYTQLYVDRDNNRSTGACVDSTTCGYDMVLTMYHMGDNAKYLYVEYYNETGDKVFGELMNAWIARTTPTSFAINVPALELFNMSDTIRILKVTGGIRVHDSLGEGLVIFTVPNATITLDGRPDDWPQGALLITDTEDTYFSPSVDAVYMASDGEYLYLRYQLNEVLPIEVVSRMIVSITASIGLDVNNDTLNEFSLTMGPACITVQDNIANTQDVYCGLEGYGFYYNGTSNIEIKIPSWLINNTIAPGASIGVSPGYMIVRIEDNLYTVPPEDAYVDPSVYKHLYSIIIVDRLAGVYPASPIYKKVIVANPVITAHQLEYGIGVIEVNATRSTAVLFTLYDRDPLDTGIPYLGNYVFKLVVSGDLDKVKWPIVVKLNLKPSLRGNVLMGYYLDDMMRPRPMTGVYTNPVEGYVKIYIDREDYMNSSGKIFYVSPRKLFSEVPPVPEVSVSGFMHKNKIFIPVIISYPYIDYTFPSFNARIVESASYTIRVDKAGRGMYIVSVTVYDFDPTKSVYYTVMLNIDMVDVKNQLEFTWKEALTISAFDPIILYNLNNINKILTGLDETISYINMTLNIVNSRTTIISNKVSDIQVRLVEMNSTIITKLVTIDDTLARVNKSTSKILDEVTGVKAILVDVNQTTALLYTTLGTVVANLSSLAIQMMEITRNITIIDTNLGRMIALTSDALKMLEKLSIQLGEINATSIRLIDNMIEVNTTLGLIRLESMDMLARLSQLVNGLENLLARTENLSLQLATVQDTASRLEQLSTGIAGGIVNISTTINNYNNITSKKLDQILSNSQDSARFSSLANIRIEEFKRVSTSLFAAVLASLVVIFSLTWHIAATRNKPKPS